MTKPLNLPNPASSVTDVDGYTRFKDIFIPLRDDTKLCADVFLPFSTTKENRRAPVIASFGPYGKDIHAPVFGLPQTSIYSDMCKKVSPAGPDACFELVDPLIWTKEYGYAVVRVDSRGVGKSEGRLDPFGLERCQQIGCDAEGEDLFDVIEWIGTQSWTTGKVALSGISYYGMVGYWAAMQQPPHLSCIVCYEALADMYQALRRGGVYSKDFQSFWYHMTVLPYRANASEDKARPGTDFADYVGIALETEHMSQGPWPVLRRERDFSKVKVPMYTAGNWADCELHLPGNIQAFNRAASEHKWLEMHTGNHIASFYEPDRIATQKKFLDYFLMDKHDNGQLDVPRVRMGIRPTVDQMYFRTEEAFPPPDRRNTPMFLASGCKLQSTAPSEAPKALEYQGLTGRITFDSSPFKQKVEILGTPYLEVDVSTEAQDLDMFVYLRVIDPSGKPVEVRGNHDEITISFCRGYWRLSHREEYREFLIEGVPSTLDAAPAKVEKGKKYSVIVPLFPTSFAIDSDYSLQLELGSVDEQATVGFMCHTGGDRTEARFGGKNTVWSNGRLILPTVNRP